MPEEILPQSDEPERTETRATAHDDTGANARDEQSPRPGSAQSRDAVAGHEGGRYETLLNSVDGIVWEAEGNPLRFLFVSRQAERILGYPVERWLNEPEFWETHIHPEDRERTVMLCRRDIRARRSHRLEYRMLKADGESISLSDFVTVFEEDGRLMLRGIATDITERKAIEEGRDHFFTVSPDMLAICNFDGRLTRVNPAWQKTIGYTVEELTARPFIEFVHPDDRARTVAELGKSVAGGEIMNFENRYICRDGSYKWLLWNAAPVPEQRLVYAVAHDITARRQNEEKLRESEDRYRDLVENTHELLCVHDLDGYISEANQVAANILGYDPDYLLGKNVRDFLTPETRDEFEVYLDKVRREGTAQGLMQVRTARGEKRIWVYKNILRTEGVAYPVVRAMAHDITERKRSEARLREMNLQLIQAQKMESIGTLTSGVAHNFRNILAAIDLGTGLLRKKLVQRYDVSEGGDILKYLQIISEASQRAAKATGQLLAFSSREMLKPVLLDLNHLILNEIDSLLQQSLNTRIYLRRELQAGLGHVRVDKMQMEQVIINLALNARDAMPEGGEFCIQTSDVFIDAETAQRRGIEEAGHYVRLALTDTGTGMDEETSERIFEPFFTTKEPGKGTGLGLSMAYGIIKQSGGHIRVESEAGRGTTFEIFLPRVDEQSARDIETHPRAKVPDEHETVLRVEDDELVRPLLHEELQLNGFDVLVAEDGAGAERIATAHPGPIHIMITDLNMPGIGGEELAERLGKMRPAMKILFISGYPQESLGQHGAGVDFLQKPFAVPLSQKVREVLDGSPKTRS